MSTRTIQLDFHLHTQEDPHDYIKYDSIKLVDMMAERGYQAFAVTNHDRFTWSERLRDYARERGIIVFRGAERTIRGRHVLLINFTGELSDYRSLHDIAAAKRPDNLVIAAHPYFPMPTASGRSARRRLIASTGTWPSTTYPSTLAVWQLAAASGTPFFTL